jgi:hypothetical protein
MIDPELIKYDVRVRERMLRKGTISEPEVRKRLESLPDHEGKHDFVELRQPAYGRADVYPPLGAGPVSRRPAAALAGRIAPSTPAAPAAPPVRPALNLESVEASTAPEAEEDEEDEDEDETAEIDEKWGDEK